MCRMIYFFFMSKVKKFRMNDTFVKYQEQHIYIDMYNKKNLRYLLQNYLI